MTYNHRWVDRVVEHQWSIFSIITGFTGCVKKERLPPAPIIMTLGPSGPATSGPGYENCGGWILTGRSGRKCYGMRNLLKAQQAAHFGVQLIEVLLLKATNRLKDSPPVNGAELKDQ